MPYIDKNEAGHIVGIYAVQQREGQEFTEEAVELYSPPPTAAEVALAQIRALEAPLDDDFKKLQRQFLIAALFKEAKALAMSNPATSDWSDAQIHAYLMSQANASGKGYAKLVLLEEAVAPLREHIP